MASDTSSEALDRVLALAEKATPGPWHVYQQTCLAGDVRGGQRIHGADQYADHVAQDATMADSMYIAAAHPAFVASLIREVQRLREATTWRPMETAPLQGTYILLRGPGHVSLGQGWATSDPGWPPATWWSQGRRIKPTAWMPLPSTEET